MPALSPRTQQMQAGMDAGPDQETALFEQGFSDMSYAVLSSRMPDVVADVVTFKILDVDIDKGSGVGAFVVLRNEQPIYIPVVLADNAVKPLEIFYHKKLNVFLPLTKGWLDEIDKTALSSLGTGVKTPETLYTDVDIRNVVVPPITGRFSYASASPAERAAHDRATAAFPLDVAFSVQHLEKVAEERALMLPSLLAAAPNAMKVAYTRLLQKNPRLLKQAAATYGMSALQHALAPRLEKVAAKQQHGGALWIADKDNTPTDFRRIFGDKAAEAYAGVRKKGFAAKDERLNRNMAVQEQPYAQWTEPNKPGIYCLYDSTGGEDYAFVMPNPIDVFDEGTRYGRRPAVPGHNPLIDNSYSDPAPHRESHNVYPYGRPDESDYATRRGYMAKPYLAVFSNGDYIEPMKLVGQLSVADEVSGPLHKRMFTDVDGAPKAGNGFFVRQKGTTFQATVPVEIKSVTTTSDNVRHVRIVQPGGFGMERVLATDPRNAYNSIWMPKGADVVYLPPDFIWIPLKAKKNARAWMQSALDLAACASSMLGSVGAKKVPIRDAGARQFSVAGSLPMERVAALKKLAFEYVLSVDDADAILTKVAAEGATVVWIGSLEQFAHAQLRLNKVAADDDKKKSDSGDKPKKKSPPPSAGSGGGGGPPDAGGDPGMDPSMGQEAAMAAMAPPPPPPPAPLNLAAMEMDQALQLEMQRIIDKQQTIQLLLQRSHEIGGGAPVAPMVQSQAMGAPPPSMNLATGGPSTMGPSPMGPQPGMSPGMDPSMGAAVPPGMPPGGPFPPAANDPAMMGGAGGMPPGGDPSMGMGMPPAGGPGGDPSMGGMPGMDPSMGMGMPPGGGMPGGDPSMGMGGAPQPPHAMMPPDGPNAMALPQEVNPQFLDQAAALHSADMFDAAAVATLAQSPALHGVVAQYLPNLEKTIDNLARVRLTLWMQEGDLKPQIGEQTFSDLDENLQSTFKGLGDLVLRLSRGVQAVKEPDDHAT